MKIYPDIRLRRLRLTVSRRQIFDEPVPGPEKFIWPVFVKKGRKSKEPIDSMPGQFRYSVDMLLHDIKSIMDMKIGGILIFGIPDDSTKDMHGSEAWNPFGVVQDAVRNVKSAFPEILVFTDVCLCAYTTHGHCGTLRDDGLVDNDVTCDNLAKIAVSHAQAGADGVAPSAMMDGQVAVIRRALSENGFNDVLLMSYSTKFSSSIYGPFREAQHSTPTGGDRQGYQISYRNTNIAIRESLYDELEGADILMVKPSIFYLDIISRLRELTMLPMAAYNVSGEYAMLINASRSGIGDLKLMVKESLCAIRRAGADIIISYWANQYKEIFEL